MTPQAAVPDRVRWAVELVDPRPDEQLLEVGCGPGVAAALLCARLTTGQLLAVDRSATAVERTRLRNAEHLAAGRLRVEQAALAGLALPPGRLDQVLCLDVNLFWTGPAARELAVVHAGLRPGGRLHVLYGTGPTGADRVAPAVAAALTAAGFSPVEVLTDPRGSGVTGVRPG
jgi:SAM-dependent methyltransferase